VHNIRTDVANGQVIRSQNLAQVDVRMRGLDQLIVDWNRNLDDARRVANAYEVVQGETLPSGTPFQLGQLIDVNASKLFVFLRQKFGRPYAEKFKRFQLPTLVADLKMQEVIRITGDEQLIARFRQMVVEDWYVQNLVAIGPHAPELADTLKR